jgi:hypothetical protein
MASGYYYMDTLAFNGQSIPNFGFLYADVVNNLTESVFGTGYAALEQNPTGPYQNLPLRLTSEGYINNPVFSLYLNSDRSTPGSILYGGVDSAKYCGNLATLPVQPNPNITPATYDQFNVQLANITATGPNGGSATIMSNPGLPALFDTGTNTISLPQDMYNSVLSLYNAQAPSTARGYPQVDCSLGTSSYSMSFGFAGVTINVPLSEVVEADNGGSSCSLYVSSQAAGENPPIILGDSFLTSAYTVFDLVDNNLYVAQAIFNAQGSNIMEVSKGSSNVVPLVAGAACSATTSTTTAAVASSTTANTNTNDATLTSGATTVASPAGSTTTSIPGSVIISPSLNSMTSTSAISYVISPYPTSTTTATSMSHGWPWSCPGGGWWTTLAPGQSMWSEWNGVTITESCSYSAVTTVTSHIPCTNIIPFTTSTAWSNGQPYPVCINQSVSKSTMADHREHRLSARMPSTATPSPGTSPAALSSPTCQPQLVARGARTTKAGLTLMVVPMTVSGLTMATVVPTTASGPTTATAMAVATAASGPRPAPHPCLPSPLAGTTPAPLPPRAVQAGTTPVSLHPLQTLPFLDLRVVRAGVMLVLVLRPRPPLEAAGRMLRRRRRRRQHLLGVRRAGTMSSRTSVLLRARALCRRWRCWWRCRLC